MILAVFVPGLPAFTFSIFCLLQRRTLQFLELPGVYFPRFLLSATPYSSILGTSWRLLSSIPPFGNALGLNSFGPPAFTFLNSSFWQRFEAHFLETTGVYFPKFLLFTTQQMPHQKREVSPHQDSQSQREIPLFNNQKLYTQHLFTTNDDMQPYVHRQYLLTAAQFPYTLLLPAGILCGIGIPAAHVLLQELHLSG